MDSQKDTPHPIAQYNSISNSQYSTENNASQFMIKALILLPKVGTADSYIKGLPTLLESSCYARRSKAWSEAGGLIQLYICSGVTLTSLGEMLSRALTSLGLLLPIINNKE